MKKISIDWLQFTVQKKSYLGVITEVLKLNYKLFEPLPKGKMGYSKQMHYENISVLYDGKEDMGIHVIISGQGCRKYEEFHPLINLIFRLNKIDAKATRIDLALDDRVGDLLPFKKMLADIKRGNVLSKWKTSTEIIKRDMEGKTIGQTINVGSRTSGTFLRIYNKAQEQNLENVIWTRLELEIKGKNAEVLQKKMQVHNVGTLIQGILKNYLRILTPNRKDKNKSRWKNRPYWDNIIQEVEKIKLTSKGSDKTLDDTKIWLEKQVGQSLAMVSISDGDVDFVYNLITESSKKLSAKNKQKIIQYEKLEEIRKKETRERMENEYENEVWGEYNNVK